MTRPRSAFAVALLTLFVAAALLGPYVAPYDPLAPMPLDALKAPSLSHAFGTDAYGRDILSRVLVATRLDLTIALAAVLIALIAGRPWEPCPAGRRLARSHHWTHHRYDHGVSAFRSGCGHRRGARKLDLFRHRRHGGRQPALLRASGAKRRQSPAQAAYVEAAALAGFSPLLIVLLHILPNIAPPLMCCRRSISAGRF